MFWEKILEYLFLKKSIKILQSSSEIGSFKVLNKWNNNGSNLTFKIKKLIFQKKTCSTFFYLSFAKIFFKSNVFKRI